MGIKPIIVIVRYDKQINVLIEDIWSGRKVDERRYKEYSKIFTIKN